MSFDVKRVPAVINALKAGNARLIVAAKKGMLVGMKEWQGHIEKSQMTRRPGLRVGTGALRRSGRTWADYSGEYVNTQWGYPNAPYVVYHQSGGVFTSRGKMFTIPLNKKAENSRPGDWPNLFVIKGKASGKLLLMNKVDDFTIEPMWVLSRTIKMPKRLWIPEEFNKFGRFRVFQRIADAINKAFIK